MKSKCLLFLTLCLFFNACSNEDELMTPDKKRVKREISAEESYIESNIKFFSWALNAYDYLLVEKCKDAWEWSWIMDYHAGSNVTDKIKRLNLTSPSGWDLQKIEFAMGTIVNMDYFPITIEKMPTLNGKQLSPLEFFEHVRKHINDFIDPNTGVKFRPIDTLPEGSKLEGETELWESNNPFLAVLSIRIPVLVVGHNDGSVICSNYTTYEKLIPISYWIFTTIKSPIDGDHPVSGNRKFGYSKNNDGSYTFYTRGVDRVQSNEILKDPQGWVSDIAFSGSDALWSSFQKGVQDFVNSHSGKAQAQASKSVRPDWSSVKEVRDGKKYLKDLVCKQS